MVLSVKGFRDEAGVFSLAVVRLAENNGKGLEPCAIAAENARHGTGVNATGQEHPDRNVAHHMHVDGLRYCAMEFVFDLLAFGVIGRNITTTVLLRASQVPIHLLTERAVFPNQRVSWR